MEISFVKIAGHPVAVLFTGSHYYFKSDFYGLICQATRTSDPGDVDGPAAFSLRAGNDHTIGGRLTKSTIIAGAKRFINKSENKYISRKVIYQEDAQSCNNLYLSVEAREY